MPSSFGVMRQKNTSLTVSGKSFSDISSPTTIGRRIGLRRAWYNASVAPNLSHYRTLLSYFTDEANAVLKDGPYLDVSESVSGDCYAAMTVVFTAFRRVLDIRDVDGYGGRSSKFEYSVDRSQLSIHS
jgi:hypothetical protein